MSSAERIQVPKPPLFITTAYGKAEKADFARNAGYELLPQNLYYIAAEAGRREDLFADLLGLRVADHHYHRNMDIPNTVHAAANKAEGVDWCYEKLKRNSPGSAMELTDRKYRVMDNQMIVVDPSGHKVALKKLRNDIPTHFQHDIEKLIDVMNTGSKEGSHIEYLSTFVGGVFGHPTIKEYESVRTKVGKILPNINLGLMAQFMTNNLHATGAMNIEELIAHFVDHSEADVRVRKYKEGKRHYEGEVVFVDQLVLTSERSVVLPTQDPKVLSKFTRGFV